MSHITSFLLVVCNKIDYLAPYPRYYHICSVLDFLWPWEVRFRKGGWNYKPCALSSSYVNLS